MQHDLILIPYASKSIGIMPIITNSVLSDVIVKTLKILRAMSVFAFEVVT